MTPRLSPLQGRLLRSLALYLSKGGKELMTSASDGGLVVESAIAAPWSSLTFTGERHGLLVHLPPGVTATAIDGADLTVANAIVAVERADWSHGDDGGARLALDLLVIAHPQ